MKRVTQLILLAALIGVGIWAWLKFFPGPEQVIRKRMSELAELATFDASTSLVAKELRVGKITALFASNVVIRVEAAGFDPVYVTGRSSLREELRTPMLGLKELGVEFLDVSVTVAEDKKSAVVETTARAGRQANDNFFVKEIKVHFLKTDEGWLIVRVESVRTLTHDGLGSPSERQGPAVDMPVCSGKSPAFTTTELCVGIGGRPAVFLGSALAA